MSPKNRAMSTTSIKKVPRGYLSTTTQATPNKQRLAKIDVQACMTNSIRVKMPFGTFQN